MIVKVSLCKYKKKCSLHVLDPPPPPPLHDATCLKWAVCPPACLETPNAVIRQMLRIIPSLICNQILIIH